MTYVWYRTYLGARAVRATMLAKQCEAMIGLPNSDAFSGPKVIFSKPLFNLGLTRSRLPRASPSPTSRI